MSNLVKRVLTSIVLVLMISTAVLLSSYTFLALLLVVNCIGLYEFYRLFSAHSVSPAWVQGIILSLSLLLSSFFVIAGKIPAQYLLVNIPLYFLIFVSELYSRAEQPFQNIAITLLGVMFVTLALCFFAAVGFISKEHSQYHPHMIMGCFLILWASDSGAYLFGKRFGKHKLFERISPNKTWEGSIAGAVCALLVSYIVSLFAVEADVIGWLFISIIITIAGTYGDLVKSLMKRSLGVKDAGNILPGHGGILDRFDSLLGSAAFVYLFLVLYQHA